MMYQKRKRGDSTNKKCFAMSVLVVLALLPVAFAPAPSEVGKNEPAMILTESQTVEVIPLNITFRSALARFSLFYNRTTFHPNLGRNLSLLGYRLAGNISGWETAVFYFYGLHCVLNGDVETQAWVGLDARFGLPDCLPQFTTLPHFLRAWTETDYDSFEDETRVWWHFDGPAGATYPAPDARVPISGSWLFIDLYVYNETPIDDLRIGLSLYLQR